MSTENTSVAKAQPTSVKDFLALPAYKSRFEEVLGKRAPQFMASISNVVAQSSQLSKCEPRSIIAAAFVAATLDLPIDKNLGFAWVVPYKDQASFQLGYKGFVQLALRSGQYARMNACAVNAEAFNGYDEVGEPVIDWSKLDELKPAVGYAASWRLTNGFTKVVYWTKEKVQAHAQRFSQAYRSSSRFDSPWKSDFDSMAIKTVLKNGLSRWGILSIDLQRAVQHDQGTQSDIDVEVQHLDNDGNALFDMAGSGNMADALGMEPEVGDKQTLIDVIGAIMLDEVHMSEAQVLTLAKERGHDVKGARTLNDLSAETLGDIKNALIDIRNSAKQKK